MPRNRRKKRTNLWLLPAVIFILLAAFGLRRFLGRPGRLIVPVVKETPAANIVAGDVAGLLEVLKEKDFRIKSLEPGEDGSENFLIYVPQECPLVQANLAISRLVLSEKYRPLKSLENRKKQRLDLTFIQKDSLMLNITVLKRRIASDTITSTPKIAVALYFWPPEKPSLADQFLKIPAIKTFIVKGKNTLKEKEVFAASALEPKGYPKIDPGPNTILVDDPSGKIKDKLGKDIAAAGDPAGLYIWHGSRATEDLRVSEILAGYCSRNQLIIIEPYPTAQSLIKKAAKDNSCWYLTPDLVIEQSVSANDIIKRIKGLLAKNRSRILILLPATENAVKGLNKAITKDTYSRFEFVTASGILQ